MNPNIDLSHPPIISPLFIDKVYATVPVDITNATHIKQIEVAFEVIRQDEGFKLTKKVDYAESLSSNNNTYGKDGDMLLQYGPNSHEHNNYLRFVVNPSKNHMGIFRKLVAMIVPGGYEEFINNAKLNRIDYTFDIHGLSLNDLLMSYPRMGINRVFRKVKLLETLEMGTEPKKIVAYDKNAHLKHLNKKLTPDIQHEISDHAVTRIEVRHYRKVTYGFKEVHLQPNPFEKLTLMLYPNSCCMKGEDPTWHMFIDLPD